MEKVKIYTDGACKGNPGPGGYGCIIVKGGKTHELKGGTKETTNNIMEMTAAIVALQQLKKPSEVELTTDSQYLVKGMTEWIDGWIRKNWVNASKQPVKNKDLWQELLQLSERHKIKWIWVRGHNGHPENERADTLANEGLAEFY
ncbi:MAG: ribonuclease HI [Nitrospinota bacterium]|nr:ribonuclease HI [Nitrospinota bacterium]